MHGDVIQLGLWLRGFFTTKLPPYRTADTRGGVISCRASPVTHTQVAELHTAQPLLKAVSLRVEVMLLQ